MNEPLHRRGSHVRHAVIAMLFMTTAFSYGDRVVLSIAGVSFARDLHLDALHMGYLFSGFSWAYVAAQLPAGGLLDRYGAKKVYGISIFCWSVCAALAGFAGYLLPAMAFGVIFALRLISGLAQSPVFPGNGRVVAAWFPTKERGLASALFNSSQYFAVVMFSPLMGWIAQRWGWKECFWLLGLLGLGLTIAWQRVIHDVKSHPRIHPEEIRLIEEGGGLCAIGATPKSAPNVGFSFAGVGALLRNHMLIGIYLGQYCINTLTWFFLTWFPLYLSQARHMSITRVGIISALPALCGSIGGISGGVVSDLLVRRGFSLTIARKVPIVCGMLLAMTVVLCNHIDTQWGAIAMMSVAFFGKGFGALGWTVISDTSPRTMIGLNGGVFNLIGNLAGITTPVIIGYIVEKTGSFHDALIYVACAALFAILSYVPLAGKIRRLELSELQPGTVAA